MISGHFKETIIRVYDVRPSTAEFMMEVLETISQATKNEYHRGWIEGQGALRKELLSAEPKKGKWIKGINGFVCSECGYRSILKPFGLVEQDGEMKQVTEMNFCYKCGADMRGAE